MTTLGSIKQALASVKIETWEIDSEKQDDLSPPHHEFALFNSDGHRMCGTENHDYRFGEINSAGPDEDGFFYAWSEPSKRLMEYIASVNPSAISELLREYEAMREENKRLAEALAECEDYFDNRADADHDGTGFVPNEEMVLLSKVQSALEALKVTKPVTQTTQPGFPTRSPDPVSAVLSQLRQSTAIDPVFRAALSPSEQGEAKR